MRRLSLLLLCCGAGLLVAAPAPLPKPRRVSEATTLESCQGVWAIDRYEVADGQGRLKQVEWGITHFRITGDRWALLNKGEVVADTYRLAMDASKTPTHVDWLERDGPQKTVHYVGIVRRQGAQLQITFINGSTNRPVNFDNLPANTSLVTARK